MKYLLILFFCMVSFFGVAQTQNYKVIDVPGNEGYFSSIELAPDGKTLALGTEKGFILMWDLETKKVTRSIELSGFKHGPYMSFTSDGKYILLLEQIYTRYAIDKDIPTRVVVLDVATGQVLIDKPHLNAAKITPDNKTLVGLKDGEIIFWNILSGKEEKRFKPDNATSSFAICKDGELVAVAQKPTQSDLENIPTIRGDKKAVKEALKYREVVVFYDIKTLSRQFMADDIFDMVFSMQSFPDANTLYLFNAPNSKLNPSNTGAKRNGYIHLVNPENGAVSRTIYASNATEPIYKENSDGKYFAVTSIEQKFYVLNTVQLFDRETGELLKVFKNDFRLLEGDHMGRASFEFLPDHETMVMGYGSKLVLWKFNE